MADAPAAKPPFARSFLVGLAIFVLAIFAVLWWQDYDSHFVYGVTVDGETLGEVVSKEEWRLALQATREWAEATMGLPVALRSKVELTRMRRDLADPLVTDEALRELCREKLTFVTQVWALSVGGRDVAYVRTRDEARQVLPSIIDDYRNALMKKGKTNIIEISVDETITCHEAEASVEAVADVQGAKRVLLRGTDRVEVHVVARGESLWGIAQANSMTVDDLRKANPDLANANVIRIGQELNLIVPDPYVTIRSRERYTYTRYLPFPEQVRQDSSLWPHESHVEKAGVRGRNEVTVEISRINGVETARAFLAESEVSPSSTQSFVQGTKIYPERADGLVWPAVGRITSPYGWRGREFHRGTDIGAAYGSPVLACKDGTVILAGWNGGLGNCVIIDHGGGLESTYGHLSSISVAVGATVSRGQCLGKVGSTGRSTGAHLHFELRQDGTAFNPITRYPHGG